MRVQMDADQLHQLLDPILQEVNDLRKRCSQLEADFVTQAEIIADLERTVSYLRDDGR